jgi:hypothetical protein
VIYVNGVPVATRGDVAGGLGVNDDRLFVGSRFGSDLFFSDRIDDVKVYSRALSPVEVSAMYDSSKVVHTDSVPSLRLNMPFTTATTPTPDESGLGNDGTPHGGVTWSSSYDGCYSFDGADDYIQISDSPSLDVSQITVSAWIKPSTVAPGERNIASKDYYTGWELSQIGDGLKVNCRIGGAYYGNYLIVSGVLHVGTWTHVAFTFYGSVGTIYVDGAPVATRSDVPGVLGVNDATLCVGSRSGSALFFGGLIDEVRVYSSALSGGDVQGLYDASKADHV